jgi:hypothetical protein
VARHEGTHSRQGIDPGDHDFMALRRRQPQHRGSDQLVQRRLMLAAQRCEEMIAPGGRCSSIQKVAAQEEQCRLGWLGREQPV